MASIDDLEKIDFSKSIYIYSQTTKSPQAYKEITLQIEKRAKALNNASIKYIVNDTLCRQVSNREPQLKQFSNINDVIIFVSGRKSSNGKMLYQSCKVENKNSYFISDIDVLNKLGLSIIVVHGGGPRIKRELDKKKIISKFINGLRVTDKNIIDTVEEVLIDFNKDIVNSLKKLG